MAGIIIGVAVAGYSGYLIYRQVKSAREGNFCGNCSGCPSARNCEQLKL